jgi:hypothetical protein
MAKNYKKLLVVILAYNEAGRVEKVVESVNKHLPECSTIVINDGSSDRTKKTALDAGCNVISHTFNLGYGASLETGYLYALQHGYDYVFQMDGDGQHLAEEAYKVITPVVNQEADIAIGSRYLEDSTYQTSFHRRLGQKVFSSIYKMITGNTIADPTSGFQCLNRKALSFNLKTMFPNDFPDVDVLLMAYFAKLIIKEVAVVMRERSSGSSMHDGFKTINYVFKMLFSIFIVVLNSKKLSKYRSRENGN